jgi:VWFA-related protein
MRLALTSALLLNALLLPVTIPAQTTPSTPPTLNVYTREVEVDINVTDAKGNSVHGLTQSDFTVLQDGQPISPSSFREHRPDDPGDILAAAKPNLPPNTFTNAGAPPTIRPLYILLLDSHDTPVMTQSTVQKAMVDFVANLPTGTRIAVFSLSATGKLSIVQGFTSDADLLKKAIKNHKFDLAIPPLEDAGQDSINNGPPPLPGQSIVNSSLECNHAAARGEYTLSAFIQIARYLSGIPGRKNIIWYTGAFPSRMKCYDFKEAQLGADGLLAHSHAFVYPIDPRALDAEARYGVGNPITLMQTSEHTNMQNIAANTGGKAIYNTNNLADAAQQAIEAGSNFYTITYVPTNQVMDTRAHSISIQVDKPDLNLLYRHGYHALPPDVTITGQTVEKATALQTSMMPGTLQPTQVLFHVTATQAPTPDATLPPNNNPADPKTMKPPFRHLSLIYTVDLKGIEFDSAADGLYHGQFEYAVNIYDPNTGQLVNSSTMAAKPALPPTVYQSMLATGAKLRQEIDLPAKGDYILRLGVHDLTTDSVGALEFPLSALTP